MPTRAASTSSKDPNRDNEVIMPDPVDLYVPGLFPAMDSSGSSSFGSKSGVAASECRSDESPFMKSRDIFRENVKQVGKSIFPLLSSESVSVETSDDDGVDEESNPIITIKSSIIDDVINNLNIEDQDRNKFFHLYKDACDRRSLQDDDPIHAFESSDLSDFEKYKKQSQINDMISDKVRERLIHDNEKNYLNIADQEVLVENFFADYSEEAQKLNPKQLAKGRFKERLNSNLKSFNKAVFKPSDHPARGRVSYGDLMASDTVDIEKFNPIQDSYYIRDLEGSSLDLRHSNTLPQQVQSQWHQNQPNCSLSRKLSVRSLQMIALGGTIGVGLFLNSGKALTIGGPLGALLGFSIAGTIVLCTMVSFCEMVTLISVADGVSGMASRFVDDAFGFSVGWLYFLSFALGLPAEIIAGCILLSYYKDLNVPSPSTAGWVTFFLCFVFGINLLDIRVFGELEYFSSLFKLLVTLVLIILMIAFNKGAFLHRDIGFTYWDSGKSDIIHGLTYGPFRPTFDLQDTGNGAVDGIGGGTGRFLAVLVSVLIASYAFSGSEIVCIAAVEAKNPRKALPSATKRVFWRILIFYCLSIFCVGLNVYAGDPRLLRYYSGSTGIPASEFTSNYAIGVLGHSKCDSGSLIYAGFANGNQSPWIIAFQTAGLCNFSAALNGIFIFFAISAGISQVYVASRTLYSMAIQGKAFKFLANCNRYGTPYNAVLFSGSFGFLAYLSVNNAATNVFQNLTNIVATSGILVWFAMCLAFLRFYYALKNRPDIISRDDAAYPYRSPFQPYTACVGMFGSAVIILAMGFVVFIKHEWDTLFFFTSYGTLILFVILYFGYRIVRGARIQKLEQLDLDSGRREMDRVIWEEEKHYNDSAKELIRKAISFLA